VLLIVLRGICLALLLSLPVAPAWGKVVATEFDAERNRVIALVLSRQLPAQHFSHKAIDDTLSQSAFTLYLKSMDPQKRFLLRQDVEQLGAFSRHIDDELRQGRLLLPEAAAAILKERIQQVQSLAEELLAGSFDPWRDESIELDPKKEEFAAGWDDLRDRWRRFLKMQIINRYLELDDERIAAAAKAAADKGQNSAAATTAPASQDRVYDAELWREAQEKIRKSNQRYFQRLLREDPQEYYNRYFNAVTQAYDPHSTYMPPAGKEDFDIHMSGSLEGIGALLKEEDGFIKVVRVIPGSAAARQGQLHAEDTILQVAEADGEPVDLIEMRIREAVGHIRGPKGTVVRLTVRKPDGAKLVIPLVRDVVQIEDSFVKSMVLDTEAGAKIGYLRIPSFYRDFDGERKGEGARNVADDVRAELSQLQGQKIQGLIVDLRNNGGGSLSDAVDVSGLFIASGPVVQVKNAQGQVRLLEDTDPAVVYTGPLVVLVNQFSASASEIFAGALQDYGRALIIGGRSTHGKGTVQALVDLNRNLPLLQLKQFEDLGALKVTIQKFYRVNGDSTQFRGVVPDVVLPDLLGHLESGEQYLEHALPWDRVPPAAHESWRGPSFIAKDVQRKAGEHLAASKQFATIRDEAEKARARSADTRMRLVLDDIRQRKKEIKQSVEVRQHGGLGANDPEAAEIGAEGEASGTRQEQGPDAWRSEVGKDPYVHEASLLLGLSRNSRGVAGAVK